MTKLIVAICNFVNAFELHYTQLLRQYLERKGENKNGEIRDICNLKARVDQMHMSDGDRIIINVELRLT
jgi:hypothetical protein